MTESIQILMEKDRLQPLADNIKVLKGSDSITLQQMEDIIEETNTDIVSQANLITQLANALQGKSVPGGSGASVETCTVTVTGGGSSTRVHYTAFENETMCAKEIGGARGVTIENVVCGSFVFFSNIGALLSATATAGTIMEKSGESMYYEAPREPVDASITVERD